MSGLENKTIAELLSGFEAALAIQMLEVTEDSSSVLLDFDEDDLKKIKKINTLEVEVVGFIKTLNR